MGSGADAINMIDEYEEAETVQEQMEAMSHYAAALAATEMQIGGDHYAKYGDMQPIHILARYLTPEEFRGYTKGVALVYLMRERDKGGDQDIDKALHHIRLWKELRRG